MKSALLLLLILLSTGILSARALEVRAGGTYTNLQPAAAAALPGDTILFRGGVYPGGQAVGELQGTPSAWVTILAAPGEEVIIRGGGNAWQISDAAYVRISGFIMEGQTLNGFNIDDAGTFDTPAHHIIIERCQWRGIDATGNNDQLKMSGVDSFEVRDNIFADGAAGGSMIDMVGCHEGLFTGNIFQRAGSNCIQAKGGTRAIVIERNAFLEGGARAINIGGSTGLAFFRPQGINYEASDIKVFSNVFTGSDAPVAFVGSVNSQVVNNTIYRPGRWALRILQETTDSTFLEVGDNTFSNNIVVIDATAQATLVNIGPKTREETFTFANNLWYNIDNPGWAGPDLPAPETNGIYGRNPMLANPPSDMTPQPGSPAIGAGVQLSEPLFDYRGRRFATPPSIGAIEGAVVNMGVRGEKESTGALRVVNGAHGVRVIVTAAGGDLALFDLRGRLITRRELSEPGMELSLGELPGGVYLVVHRRGDAVETVPVLVR
jgi:hypothetical protein